jgi:hypothetical protein
MFGVIDNILLLYQKHTLLHSEILLIYIARENGRYLYASGLAPPLTCLTRATSNKNEMTKQKKRTGKTYA